MQPDCLGKQGMPYRKALQVLSMLGSSYTWYIAVTRLLTKSSKQQQQQQYSTTSRHLQGLKQLGEDGLLARDSVVNGFH